MTALGPAAAVSHTYDLLYRHANASGGRGTVLHPDCASHFCCELFDFVKFDCWNNGGMRKWKRLEGFRPPDL